jgi:hypothetical protein
MPPYTSNIQVFNGTSDITSIIEFDGSFNVQSVLTKQKGQATFSIKAPNAPTLPANMPTYGDDIYVKYTINGNTQLIFGGTLVTIEPIVSGGLVLYYQCTAMDWGYLLDSLVVKKNYAGMDPHDIVVDIIEHFTPSGAGFTTNHVQVGAFLVSTMQFNYMPVSKALQKLAQQIGWDWYIDPNKDVHFYFAEGNVGSSSEILPAPIVIDDTSGQIEWPTLDVQIDITNMKNAVYVVGGTYAKDFVLSPNPAATPPQYAPVDVYTSVAGTFVYPLAYPYDESTLTITLAGVGQAIGTDQQTDPSLVQVLYNDMGRFIRFTSDPGTGHKIVVQGQAQIPILAYVTNPASIAMMAALLGTNGVIEDSIVDTTILSVEEAQERAQADIDMFGHPVFTVKFNTISPLANQLAIGQQITLNSVKFGVSNKTLIIKQINFVARTPFQLEAQVQCLGSESVTYNDIMLQLLQQNLGNQSTPSSTVLQVLLPVGENIVVGEAITITAVSGPYVWGPSIVTLQSAEGGAEYGSFGYGSFAYGGGLPYADDAPSLAPQPVMIWGLFTWQE